MRSIWENVAERVYENDAAQGISSYNTPRLGPEELASGTQLTTTPVTSTTGQESPGEIQSNLETSVPVKKENGRRLDSSPSVTSVKSATDQTEGWKPLSLSTPILMFLIAFTLLIAAGIETIAQRSKAQGGLALSPSIEEIPDYAMIIYLYVPTLVAVIYSIAWSWIDLDVKRMQPWFELSKPTGAQAKDSLFLDYQFDFMAFVPVYAARRRHWPVFFAGTATVIVLWLLTPLQSAVLGTSTVMKTEPATIEIRSELQSLNDQVATLGPEFLNTGYAIGWLNQSFPAFMASTYALLPFYLQKDPTPTKLESNWTASTTKLTTDLDCWPAEIVREEPLTKMSYNFLNGRGCNATMSFNKGRNYSMYYVGYYSSAYSDYWLAGPECPESANSSHQFLAVWVKPVSVRGSEIPDFNITALYCETSYYKQNVVATVESLNFVPVNTSIHGLSDREILSEDEFNSTAFEYVLGNGMAANPVQADWPFSQVVEQSPRLRNMNLLLPISNMVGFALAGRDLPITDYHDEKLLAKVYREAHQYLFSAAISELIINSTDISNTTASVDFVLSGIVVSRVWATTVECLLLAVACITAAVLWLCRIAPSNLLVNPSSLRRQAYLFRDSPELLNSFRSMDNVYEKDLFEEFKTDKFSLINDSDLNRPRVLIERGGSEAESPVRMKTSTQKGYYEPVRPLALRRESGILFIACIVGVMAGLSYLKRQETVHNGLSQPSTNFEVLQLLENYIPTIIATLIEPFWVLLNRLLCVLQPFADLWEGKTKASRSIDATYTSIPSQLVAWRALKSRHYLLVIMCVASFLANLLAVGLGSLFNENVTETIHSQYLRPAFAPRFNNETVYNFSRYLNNNLQSSVIYQDPMYIVLANLSSETTLPAWVSPEYYFQRYDLTTPITAGLHYYYTLSTRGFGVHVNCTSIPSSSIPTNITVDGTTETDSCASLAGVETARELMRNPGRTRSWGNSAVEQITALTRYSGPEKCDPPLTIGWGRTLFGQDKNATLYASFAICRPSFQTAMFNLTIEADGKVISYNRLTQLENALDYDDSEYHTNILFEVMNGQWVGPGNKYHNDTFTYDWMNYLMVLSNGTRSLVDPAQSVPDPDDWIPTVENVYRRTFVNLLGLNEQLFDQDNRGTAVEVTRHTRETKIFMDDASFIITMTVLAIDAIVALIFYGRAVTFVLPRMPTTLGSIIAYIAPSRIMKSGYKVAPGLTSRTFSYGRYIAYDGRVQLGIEMDPHVVPVDPSSLKESKHLMYRLGIRKGKEEKRRVQEGTWL